MDHPSENKLRRFVAGRLSGSASAAVESHLVRCEQCVDVLKDLSDADSLVLLIQGATPPRDHPIEPVRRRDSSQASSPNPLCSNPDDVAQPEIIGRYRIDRILGQGGWGIVYLAWDQELERPVAVKVAHGSLVVPQRTQLSLTEARAVARLDHAAIVPVYDVGSTHEYPCYIVSKYIEGTNLADCIKERRFRRGETSKLVATLSEALHHAHEQGIVHRDVKPRNILLDGDGKPYLTDFGLALREDDTGTGPRFIGTPAYMSPEQARGEGHRVDARSDVFSVGVVLYELLAGRRPFHAETQEELLGDVTRAEPRSLRQYDESIPLELERICQRAMERRASDRYPTAHALADDLKRFLDDSTQQISERPVDVAASAQAATTLAGQDAMQRDGGSSIRIVPKGLRSFDAYDADFFLQLLPGPRDYHGLPDSIRFWKSRIEATRSESSFSIGLIYGPSGCGKSSMVKAGLLPCLSKHVTPIYLEATANATESQLLDRLRSACPSLPSSLNLRDALAALRRGHGRSVGKKLVIFLDQFEQWLHVRRETTQLDLVDALRQCDGEHVQCVMMIRVDFWMEVTRFMQDLEVPLRDGFNSFAVDLFDEDHARKVLIAYGHAFGRLPRDIGRATTKQREFLVLAIQGLANDGKINCAHLALFAEMMKSRQWTPETLAALGGTRGVGTTFLDQTFSDSNASPGCRYHETPARSVLNALLPEAGSDIRGQVQSYATLLEVSGYGPTQFRDLISILDHELRLITPAGSENVGDPSTHRSKIGYQLTHDYLVPSLKDWLTRKQKETRKGRAELRLVERSAEWKNKPEKRNLPSLWEYANIRLLTEGKMWTDSQRRMMSCAGRRYAVWSCNAIVLIIAMSLIGANYRDSMRQARHEQVSAQLDTLLKANPAALPVILDQIDVSDSEVSRRLEELANDDSLAPAESWRVSLALLPLDDSHVQRLFDRLLVAPIDEISILCSTLLPYGDELADELWAQLRQDAVPRESERLRTSTALAVFDAHDRRWLEVADEIAAELVSVNPVYRSQWRDMLHSVGASLLPALGRLLADDQRPQSERMIAADLFFFYAASNPDAVDVLTAKLEEPPSPETQTLIHAKRKANTMTALMRFGHYDLVQSHLSPSTDPTARSLWVHQLSSARVDVLTVISALRPEVKASRRMVLLQALGQYDQTSLLEHQSALTRELLDLYRNDPDPAVHSSCEWVLRRWGHDAELAEVNRDLAADRFEGGRRWYVNRQGQTMMRIEGPVEFSFGGEDKASVPISFAIASKEVTAEEYSRFRTLPDLFRLNTPATQATPHERCPAVALTWYEAAAYCNWLNEKEGVSQDQWCYRPNEAGEYGPGMQILADFPRRSGYRLATEVEWEYAGRSGTTTPHFFGEAEELLDHYAWWLGNSSTKLHPVGTKMPNDFGIFDMQCNAWEWCNDRWGRPGRFGMLNWHGLPVDIDDLTDDAGFDINVVADEETRDVDIVDDDDRRVIRGGGFLDPAGTSEMLHRARRAPNHNREFYPSIRLVRSIVSDDHSK